MGMRAETYEVLFEENDKSFLKIGAAAKTDEYSMEEFSISKKEKIENLWGTLGWRNDRPLAAKGSLDFSKNGNEKHYGVTAELAELIRLQNPDIEEVKEIRERFINLSEVEVENLPELIVDEKEIHLRLELFLEKEEGALVYLQENPKGIVKNSIYSLVNLVTPEATINHTQNRTSLTYYFPFSFGKEMEFVDGKVKLLDKPKLMTTIIKVLTFVRKPLQPEESFKVANKKLNEAAIDLVQDGISTLLGEKKNKLLIFNKNSSTNSPGGNFEFIENTQSINTSLKTLLLVHGTFSTIEKSYGELCDPTVKSDGQMISPFQNFLLSTDYDQIIGFNHPTASQSVDENVTHFHKLLDGVTFNQPVSVITTSRGALVAESILCHEKTNQILTIDKMMTFAPAHGSDLLKVGKGIDKFLSLLRNMTTKTGWGYALALAQFSYKAILTQPGLNDMLPNSKKIQELETCVPNNEVVIQAMVGDFDKTLVSKKFVRVSAIGLDALIRLAFNSETDWVIGCPEQKMQIKNPKARYNLPFEMFCTHGKQFDVTHPKKDGKVVDMSGEIVGFFG
jgi:hypothetical protein